MKKAAVIGWPVKHSLSPAIHNFWRRKAGLEGRYYRVACEPKIAEFQKTVSLLQRLGYAGANVTLPHKKNAHDLATRRSEVATILGVANMLTFDGEEIIADNSDVLGLTEMVRPLFREDDLRRRALVLGAGGAAPAVCLALHQLGYQEIIISNRTRKSAEDTAAEFDFVHNFCDWSEYEEILETVDILVNTTSLGMSHNPELDIDLGMAKPSLIVADIVYTPLETGLLQKARERHLRCENGLTMLMHQAVPGFEKWLGDEAQVTHELKRYLVSRLEGKDPHPLLIGLTGSIGMGKSTAAKVLENEGAAVWDADSAVHRLYSEGGAAVEAVDTAFPGVVENGSISRQKLSAHLMQHPGDFRKLEEIVHPLVAIDRAEFIEGALRNGAKAVVLDIPLLFETGQAHEFDEVIVVTADLAVRRERVLARPGMNEEKFEAIVAKQMPEDEKVLLADHIIRTDQPLEITEQDLKALYAGILENY